MVLDLAVKHIVLDWSVFSYLLAITKIVGNFNICLRAKEVQHKGYVLDHTQEKYNNVSLVRCHSPGLKA